jgi:hypothetical protein
MTAYEELKTWCEKHLSPIDYKVVPESRSYSTTIYFIDCGIGFICFDRDGDACGMGALDEDNMYEHINEVEREEESASKIVADPPLPSIGGMMVRKMIEECERKLH